MPRSKPLPFPTLLLATVLLADCGGRPAEEAPAAAPGSAPPIARGTTLPIRFGGFGTREMRRGTEVGRYVFGVFCQPPWDPIHWTTGRGLTHTPTLEQRFRVALTAAGFDVAGSGFGEYSRAADRKRARFSVTAELTAVDLRLCRRENWLTGTRMGEDGEGRIAVEWSLHAEPEGYLVHRATTTGTAVQGEAVPDGDSLILEAAFAAAAERLAADGSFRAAVSRGAVVAPIQAAAGPAVLARTGPVVPTGRGWSETPVPTFMPVAPVMAGAGRGGTLPAVTTVAVGSGRGVVVGQSGAASLIVTAAAGPPDAMLVVRPAPAVALDGVVEGRDAVSGLALVRVQGRLDALPLRLAPVAVSEPVVLGGGGGGRVGGIVAAAGLVDVANVQPKHGDPVLDGVGNLVGFALDRPAPTSPARYGLVPFVPLADVLAGLGLLAGPSAADGDDAGSRVDGRVPGPDAGTGDPATDPLDPDEGSPT